MNKWVRSALRQLYDSPSLANHPLAAMVGQGSHSALDRAQNLRRLLIDAIQSLRPPTGAPASSAAWRTYRILELRYLEGLSPSEVMDRVALQKSQYHEIESQAVRAVGLWLLERCQSLTPSPGAPSGVSDLSPESLLSSEMELLCAGASAEMVDLREALDGLWPALERLAQTKGASVRIEPVGALQISHTNRVLVRQAILNAVSYGLDVSRGGLVEIGGVAKREGVAICIRVRAAEGAVSSAMDGEGQEIRMDVCRRLMAATRGELRLGTGGSGQWEAELLWPEATPRTLLVIDDNQGFVDLFRRYLSGHGWHVLGASDGVMARQIIAQVRPTVVTLDVLMPGEDGWELLASLRSDPASRDIPVIVCSVLREPQLAMSLGASAYLPKPVTADSLLQALAPWSARPAD